MFFCECFFFSFPLAQQPNAGQGYLVLEVRRSHTVRQTQSVGLLWTRDQPVAETST